MRVKPGERLIKGLIIIQPTEISGGLGLTIIIISIICIIIYYNKPSSLQKLNIRGNKWLLKENIGEVSRS